MTIYFCKSLIQLSLKNSSNLTKTRISLLYFSSSTKPTIAVSDYLLHTHKFSPETAAKVSSIVPYLKRPENTDSILSFFKESGFSKTHIEKVIEQVPKVLCGNLERTIKPRFKILQDLGLSSREIVDVISSEPWILVRSVYNGLGPSMLALKSLLGTDMDVSRMLKVSGWFLRCNLRKTMIPNIEFFKSCGISSSQITKFVYTFPRFFLHKPETIKEYVKRVDELGFDRKSKTYLHAIRVISSMSEETWEAKLELFKSLGFSENEIWYVFGRVPQVFAVSERKIKEITQLFLSRGDLDISYFVDHPGLLIYSVEKRLKPRLRVLEVLERKNLLPKKPTLTTACMIDDDKFLEKFVIPYTNDVGELFSVKKCSLTAEICA